ncbi:MAG: DNA-binding protein [Sphingobacteriales bacterium]|nr:MAG: DNA-binding protein [Sphingobacteriales bacterium]
MSTNIHIPKKCQYCGTMFIARTLTTRYCSHKCNSRHYKQLLKEKRVSATLAEEAPATALPTPLSTPANNLLHIAPAFSSKEFFSMKETASLLGVHERTIMNMVWKSKLPHGRIGRRIVIYKAQVLALFKLESRPDN